MDYSGNDIAHVASFGEKEVQHVLYMKDGTVLRISAYNGKLFAAFKLPTRAEIAAVSTAPKPAKGPKPSDWHVATFGLDGSD